ncbi:uncharacterized protein LOC107478467 [Arachis duranensis]|uniref:Uncharacterized protein LOC107478467 n=1 Tax=Arachis duranensis TaxID=130453 RepID=A0A9C6THE9_ARADU|nr:uncharacterized protein LOC107478467 [Arachis duranensis]
MKEQELQAQAAMKEQELQTQRYIKEMEIKAKEREMERMAKEREREMDMQILNADTSTMSEKRRALHEIAYSEEEDIDRSSIPITRRWINRDREAGHDHLFQDYFVDEPVYNADIFRWRFRMRRHVFLRIADALSNVYPYFQQRVDATGRRGLSPLQKCTATIRMLAYGVGADAINDYVRIGESTTIECLEKFVEGVISVFEDEYLRKPKLNDVQYLLQMAEGCGFPGMLGSIDCMHWQ